MAISDDEVQGWYDDAASGFTANQSGYDNLSSFNTKLSNAGVTQDQAYSVFGGAAETEQWKDDIGAITGYSWQDLNKAPATQPTQQPVQQTTTSAFNSTPAQTQDIYATNQAGVYDTVDNSSQHLWNYGIDNDNGEGANEEVYDRYRFLDQLTGMGKTHEQIDADMGWPKGSTAQWLIDNPYPQPGQPVVGQSASGLIDNGDGTSTYNGVTYTTARTGNSQWDDSSAAQGAPPAVRGPDGQMLSSTPVNSANGTPGYQYPSSVTVGPSTPGIGMRDQTNVVANNLQSAREVSSGTMQMEGDKYAQYYDMNAMYDVSESDYLSDKVMELSDPNSPYMKTMMDRVEATTAGKGISGSSMAAAAAASGLVASVLPIAQGDVTASAFNAEQQNRMMDRRQAQYGDMGLTAFRGEIDFLMEQQTAYDAVIASDLQQTFNLEKEYVQHQNILDREGLGYIANNVASYNTLAAEIQASDLENKTAHLDAAHATMMSNNNLILDYADGVDVNFDSMKVDGIQLSSGNNFDNVSYSAQDYQAFNDDTLNAGDSFYGQVGTMLDGFDFQATAAAMKSPATSEEDKAYYQSLMDANYFRDYGNQIRQDNPAGWTDVMYIYRNGGNYASAPMLREMREVLDASWDQTDAGKAYARELISQQQLASDLGGY